VSEDIGGLSHSDELGGEGRMGRHPPKWKKNQSPCYSAARECDFFKGNDGKVTKGIRNLEPENGIALEPISGRSRSPRSMSVAAAARHCAKNRKRWSRKHTVERAGGVLTKAR